MVKSVIKEIFIMLLLCIAIVLILGVIFYNYIPTNKAIPNKLAEYTTPENINSKIEEVTLENKTEEITYQIDSTDLKLYRETHGYTTGKVNPFSASTSVDNVENNTQNNNQNSQNTTGGNTQGNNDVKNVDPNSTGTFYNNTPTK